MTVAANSPRRRAQNRGDERQDLTVGQHPLAGGLVVFVLFHEASLDTRISPSGGRGPRRFAARWRKTATELAIGGPSALCKAVSSPLPDAAPANWVDRHAPPAWRPWLKLGRFDRPTGIWLLMLPGWQGIALSAAIRGDWPDPLLLAKFAAGAALMRAAGCAYNDIVDRDIDARVARTARRPIPAGEIGLRAPGAS